jgi:large subunit ribosomal protein L25
MAKAVDLTIPAEERAEFGKGAARRLRRASMVPAVLHDHGKDPVHVSLPGHQLMLALKQNNALLTIALPGSQQLALPRQIQRDPVKGFLEHVDLVVVRRGEKVTVSVGIHLEGETAPDTMVMNDLNEIELEVDPTAIPERIELSVEGLTAGASITVGQIELPAGSTLVTDPELLVLTVAAQQSAAAAEAEMAEAEAEAGIEHEAPQAPAEGE